MTDLVSSEGSEEEDKSGHWLLLLLLFLERAGVKVRRKEADSQRGTRTSK